MNTVNIMFSFMFVSIFSLIIAQTSAEAKEINDNEIVDNSQEEVSTVHDTERELIDSEKLGSSGERSISDEHHQYEHSEENNLRIRGPWRNRIRQKRSISPYEDNVLDLDSETNVKDVYSDNAYGTKDKRINTDYGYGSRLQAAENIAMDWDRNGLFGVMGPGKRSGKFDAVKRIPTDFGYGSRNRAAEVAAMSSNGGLYGLYGPGKRSNLGLALVEETPGYDITKRPTLDYGYGSRMQAAEKVADSASRGGLFGDHGPGKRTIGELFQEKYPLLENLRKRISSDFGYGSREQAAENLAKMKAKGLIFGVYGPGKRAV